MKKGWIIAIVAVLLLAVGGTAAFLLLRDREGAAGEEPPIFTVEALSQTELGVEADSAFSIALDESLTEQELRRVLLFEPSVGNYTLEGSGKSWTLTPERPLEEGIVYAARVLHPTTLAVRQSFAFQTRTDLLVSGTYPYIGDRYAMPESGIEISFNSPDVDISEHFEIQPAVEGTFETKGYKVVFQPAEPLEYGTSYLVTLKEGLTAPNGRALQKEYQFAFAVQPERDSYGGLYISGSFEETFLVGDPLVVELNGDPDYLTGDDQAVSIYRFPSLEAYAAEVKANDEYYRTGFGSQWEYQVDTEGLEVAEEYSTPLITVGRGQWNHQIPMPDELESGHYLVVISGKNSDGGEYTLQKLIQVCDESVYLQSVEGDTLVWVNSPATGQPREGVKVRLEEALSYYEDRDKEELVEVEATTGQDGVARLETGAAQSVYVTLEGDGKAVYFSRMSLSAQSEVEDISATHYSSLYKDREIYMPTDTVKFWGVVRPHDPEAVQPDEVWLTLESWNSTTPLARVRAELKADGVFSGELPLDAIQTGWHDLRVTDGKGGVYWWDSVRVEAYTKPSYTMTVRADKEFYYHGDTAVLDIEAHYYDGTPMSGGSFSLSGDVVQKLGEISFTLGEDGRARVECKLDAELGYDGSVPGWEPTSLWYNVNSTDEQDVYLSTYGSLTCLPSRTALGIEGSLAEGPVTISSAVLDESKLDDWNDYRPLIFTGSNFEQLAGDAVDIPVTVRVMKNTVTKTPESEYYDAVNKRTVTRYSYSSEESVEKTMEVSTQGGKLVLDDLRYVSNSEEQYWLEVEAQGVLGPVMASSGRNWRWDAYDSELSYTFFPDNGTQTVSQLGEELPLGLYANGEKVESQGRVLYSVVYKSMEEVGVLSDGEAKAVTVSENTMPGIQVAGAYFDGRHVYSVVSQSVALDAATKDLAIEIETDKDSYRPGEEVKASFTVLDSSGSPVKAELCVGIVDESVFALAEQNVDLLSNLYQFYSPYIAQNVSYVNYGDAVAEDASAEMGGKGGGAPSEPPLTGGGGYVEQRSVFLDTALFETLSTDGQGKGTITFNLPDNITAWRITALAVTTDLKAGTSTGQTSATLPFFLNPLVTSQYMVGDEVVVSVDCVGKDVGQGDGVDYTVTLLDAEGNELDSRTVSGSAGSRDAVNFGKLEAGSYSVVMEGTGSGGADNVKREFQVAAEGLAVTTTRTVEIGELGSLTPARYPVRLYFYDGRMKPYLDLLEALSTQTDTERTERAAAAYLAEQQMENLTPVEEQQEVQKPAVLDNMQREDGGIAVLPSSGPDAGATAKLALLAPELLDSYMLREYFRDLSGKASATQTERVMCQLGMAAMGDPVLLDLRYMLTQPQYSDTEKLYLGAAMAALGDYASADALYEGMVGKMTDTAEGWRFLSVGDETANREATAAALLLTSITGHSDATALMDYLLNAGEDKNQQEPYELELYSYARYFRLPEGEDSAKLRYTDGDGKKQEIKLGEEQGFFTLSMGATELATADFTADGDVYASVRSVEYSTGLTEDAQMVTVSKNILPLEGDELSVGGRAKVEIEISFADDAPEGIYTIYDYTPSGMRALAGDPYGYDFWRSNVSGTEGQQVIGYLYRSKDNDEEEESGQEAEESVEPAVVFSDLPAMESLLGFMSAAEEEEIAIVITEDELIVDEEPPAPPTPDSPPGEGGIPPATGGASEDVAAAYDGEEPAPDVTTGFDPGTEETPAAVSEADDLPAAVADPMEPTPPADPEMWEDDNTVRYMVSCVLPGTFVSGEVIVVGPDGTIVGRSTSGTVVIQGKK
ncbi:MAG: alpha-2-macroglobulin family protein [Oscillospiraceae bacterium]